MPSLLHCFLFSLTVLHAFSQSTNWTTSPFNPPALPLAVRSPYFSIWLGQGRDSPAVFDADNFPWVMYTSPGWYANAVVDNVEYRLLGQYDDAEGKPEQTSVEFTATRTSFIMTAGSVEFNMSFLSPIEPKNLTLQSLPFAYLSITAKSKDQTNHRVRMYSDIQQWLIAGDVSRSAKWTAEDSVDYVVLSMSLKNPVQFVENNIRSQDATMYYAFKKIEGGTTSWSIANLNDTRGVFLQNPSKGQLNNQADPATNFQPPQSLDDSPALAIGIDWGDISETPEPAVWALGVIRDPSIRYITTKGALQDRSPYFRATFADSVAAAKFVLDDFPRAQSAAAALDAQIQSAGESFSPEYAELLVISSRQCMGALDITIPPSSDGSWDTSDVKIFMKNLGSVGSDNERIASVNNVDALYAAFPAFLFLNPDIGGYLLAPLLEIQDSGLHTLPYAAQNIGPAYPNATASDLNQPHTYGIDETANMIIMTLAYSQASGNLTLAKRHYSLLQAWAEYLGNNTITPLNQSSGDFSANTDFRKANQTNLAVKGVIGIAAMAKIAEVVDENDDQKRFNDTAKSAVQFWQDHALSASHVNFFYDTPDTNGLMYNVYADKLLRLNIVPESVYTLLTSFYQNTASQSIYGMPLDNSSNQNTTTNWMMFAASTVTNSVTRNLMISQIHAYASNNVNSVPFKSIYNPTTGLGGPGTSAGIASPAQGGMFALLALNTTTKLVPGAVVPSGDPSGSSGSSGISIGAIVGILLAGLVLACIAVIFYYRCRRRKLRKAGPGVENIIEASSIPQPFVLSESTLLPEYGDDPSPDVVQTASAKRLLVQRSGVDNSGGHKAMDGDTSRRELANLSTPDIRRSSDTRNGRSVTGVRDGVEALRLEFDTLRRDVERLRQERLVFEGSEAPPSYSDPSLIQTPSP